MKCPKCGAPWVVDATETLLDGEPALHLAARLDVPSLADRIAALTESDAHELDATGSGNEYAAGLEEWKEVLARLLGTEEPK